MFVGRNKQKEIKQTKEKTCKTSGETINLAVIMIAGKNKNPKFMDLPIFPAMLKPRTKSAGPLKESPSIFKMPAKNSGTSLW